MKTYFCVALLLTIYFHLCASQNSKKSLNLTQRYIDAFKNNRIHVITTRIKSRGSHKFISVHEDSNFILANATKVQAFRYKFALMQIHKIGQIVAFYNDLASSYICYNEDGYLVKTKKQDFNELCIFIKISVEDHHRHFSYILYSEKFGTKTKLQFNCDGSAVRASSGNSDSDGESECENHSEFSLYYSFLDE